MATIVVVEDDQQIRELVTAALAADGHHVDASHTGLQGLESIVGNRPDLVVLDLGLPDIDGGELLRMIRAVSDVPIMIATARDDERDIVTLLDAGADEYVVKPYSGAEVQARVRAMLRRTSHRQERFGIGEVELDVRTRHATLRGDPMDLRRKEFDILAFLASHGGQVVTREDLFAAVWRQPSGGDEKTIDVHISWLRQKLGESAAEPRHLLTVRGVGFRLVDPTAD